MKTNTMYDFSKISNDSAHGLTVLSRGRLAALMLIGMVTVTMSGCITPLPPRTGTQSSDAVVGGAQGAPNAQVQPAVSFELGEVIAQNEQMYREFWGMTNEGYLTVQDFYLQSKKKRTDPYTLMSLDEAKTWLPAQGAMPHQYETFAHAKVGIVGPYVQWYENDNKAMECFFENKLPQKQWSLWYENTQPMLQEEWVDGVRNGQAQGWHDNGKSAGQGQYVNGVRQGEWTVWYGNGVKLQEGLYENGKQQGAWTYWHDNGARKEAGNFENGVRVGTWVWWDPKGATLREADYSPDGQVIGRRGGVGSGTIQPRTF